MDEKRECPGVEQMLDNISDCPVAPPADPVTAIALKEEPPLGWRELLVIVLLVVLCDLTIYRGHGFAGYALLMAAAPLLLAVGAPRPRWKFDYPRGRPGDVGPTSDRSRVARRASRAGRMDGLSARRPDGAQCA
ncbi:MAG: hypothetical protein KKE86_14550 [Planctomycetes bacterium]|nr:hypothetical protein [Planctomycetota bacterium]MBU4400540.1 hypothetical protein [Planctomycetota bacterium]MCG2685023.1 hypothetical protein [Planctomycetales bacterium]